MKIHNISECPLYDGDKMISISVEYSKEEIKKLNLKTNNDIKKFIKKA